MGRLSFGKGQSRSESDVAKLEFGADTDLGRVERIISKLSELPLQSKGLSCYVLGDGGMPAGTYDRLSAMVGVTVVKQGSLIPWYCFFLRGIVASEWGIVRVDDVSVLPDVFGTLIEQSMAIVFVMPSDQVEPFVARAAKRDGNDGFDHGVRKIESHLVYLVDADNHESKTGVVEYVSCGIACGDDFVGIFDWADGERHASIAT
ncbi:MAG: hypothetical protein JNM58_12920 [Xanthomonadaceae bacterium]|nr:hypothetical protein [Xanthomonadaceae bacterium]